MPITYPSARGLERKRKLAAKYGPPPAAAPAVETQTPDPAPELPELEPTTEPAAEPGEDQ